MNKIKLFAFAVFAICSWLTYGAAGLHETDPAHHSINAPIVLALIALIGIGYVFFGKSKPKIKIGPRPGAGVHL